MLQGPRASKIRGVQLAIVVDNKDGDGNPGYRIKVRFPWLNEQETTYWVRIAIPMAGPDRGTYVLPEIDDQVLVVFEHGDINRPIVIGALWSKKQEPVEVNQSGKNNTKLIKSRCGHRIIFDDAEGAERITIVDKTRKNKIVLDSVNKIVKVESDGDIEVIAKANVIIHANALKIGTSETVTWKGASLLTHASRTFGLKASGGITVGGGNTVINASNVAACTVSGTGAGELNGAGAAEHANDQVAESERGASGADAGSPRGSSSIASGGSQPPTIASGGGQPHTAEPRECKVLAIESHGRFRLCANGAFKVSKYQGSPTKADKLRIRWFVRDASTGDDLLALNKSVIEENGEELKISCIPLDWHDRTIEIGAQLDQPPKGKMFSSKPESAEVYDWIATIRKAEEAYPAWSGVAMTNALRRVAPPGKRGGAPGAPYDNEVFRMMYGHSPPGAMLAPLGPLTQSDIDQLGRWNWHEMNGQVESGIVKDADGNEFAAGHVLTGLSAGVYRNRSIDITPWYSAGIGESMDNLYATTISGDLGQVAVFVYTKRQAKPYLGNHGDATDAELMGDIDGWLIGNSEPPGGSGKKLSETLSDYYCPCNKSNQSYRNRFVAFEKTGLVALQTEIVRFASTYIHSVPTTVVDKAEMLFNIVEPSCGEAYAEFVKWLNTRVTGTK
jgi:phage baseplate assembly protein gpV